MKAMSEPLSGDERDDFTIDSCEDGLEFLAHALREDLEEGRLTTRRELDEMRKIASELLSFTAIWLGERWSSSPSSRPAALLEPKLVRLLRAIRGALHPSTSRRQVAESLQSVADLIRSTRRREALQLRPLN